jgi:putative membrane protein
MDSLYLGIKALHLIFVASWFAGLFYQPRIYVNLAMVEPGSHAERERLLMMARKLQRFASLLMWIALASGLWLWLGAGVWGLASGWLHAKVALVVLVVGVHHVNGAMLKTFEASANKRSHRWYRVYNEVSIVLFAAIVLLVVYKPF